MKKQLSSLCFVRLFSAVTLELLFKKKKKKQQQHTI